MFIHYKFLCVANKAVLHRVLCLIIEHIIDASSGDRGLCYVYKGVCYITSGSKAVSTVEVHRVGFDLMRVVVAQDVA